MGMMAKIPQGFEARAERRSWYSRADAESLLEQPYDIAANLQLFEDSNLRTQAA